MLKEKTAKADVGVIVARFQVHELHQAHKDLIDSVLARHSRVLIFLGLSPLRNTTNNPLDFKSRRKMIQESYPDIDVFYIDDVNSDEIWSNKLDKEIQRWVNPGNTVILYGSRDSFIKHYSGKNKVCELESEVYISGTEIRNQICNFYPVTKDFRAGQIAATALRFPTAYQTVDIAVFNSKNQLLLAKKELEPKWRFIGGFSDPSSPTLEDDAKREVKEEADIEVDNIKYVCSSICDDWRYRKEKDKIKTVLFKADYIFGSIQPNDDIHLLKWFDFDQIKEENIMPEHIILFKKLKEYISKSPNS